MICQKNAFLVACGRFALCHNKRSILKLHGYDCNFTSKKIFFCDLDKSLKISAFTLCQLHPSLEFVFSSAFGVHFISCIVLLIKKKFESSCSNFTVPIKPGRYTFLQNMILLESSKILASLPASEYPRGMLSHTGTCLSLSYCLTVPR